MRVAQMQTTVSPDKQENLSRLYDRLEELRGQNIDLVTLGEMFNCPYETSNFPVYAEQEGGRVYNTAYVFDRNGRQAAKHRKMHLFDIDVKGGQRFMESETLTAGDQVTVFETEFGKIGICVCFDCRFPELARLMVQSGAKVILVPAAFNMTTGPAHWEVMFRSRAIDNQCYMIGTSDARTPDYSYVAWGHSMVVDPWGRVISELDEKEGVAVTDIDSSYVDQIREQLPLLSARRTDLYELTEL